MSQMERTEWRDLGFSKHHRLWGREMYMADIDWLGVEYSGYGTPRVLVEHKRYGARPENIDPRNANNQAVANLANAANIPFFINVYSEDYAKYQLIPVNNNARIYVPHIQTLNELEYVQLMYKLRNSEIPPEVAEFIKARLR